ncbi:hypothetical protein RVR_8363 [Actinacidiphila reveromycinica]|uniref:Uncharacterized protein n=1 Tax=Actinacidiphila reveromycinica TaxID=659352 RepID=A0A7U3UYI5_9ACTN|nr:hypothetical protein [Streptomyces sp. SN-593]BBB01108.1 hypothetical protein RVR_8363 [Streptomyces sp. SN-593]
MTALSDAAQAVEEAREALLLRLFMAVGAYDHARDEALLDTLVAAVRRHDAETVREFADQEEGLLAQPKAAVYVQGIRDGADRIHTEEGQ